MNQFIKENASISLLYNRKFSLRQIPFIIVYVDPVLLIGPIQIYGASLKNIDINLKSAKLYIRTV